MEGAGLIALLGEAQRDLAPSGARAIPGPQLHFTLKFLGDVEERRLGAARSALAAGAGVDPFQVDLEGLGVFPPRGPARVVWAGCGAGAGQLTALAARVEAAFVAAGFPPEPRPFSPHLTLARVKDPAAGGRVARAVRGLPPRRFGTLEARDVVLYQSVLSPSGPAYTPLARASLGPP